MSLTDQEKKDLLCLKQIREILELHKPKMNDNHVVDCCGNFYEISYALQKVADNVYQGIGHRLSREFLQETEEK